jgi:hypothetical protein
MIGTMVVASLCSTLSVLAAGPRRLRLMCRPAIGQTRRKRYPGASANCPGTGQGWEARWSTACAERPWLPPLACHAVDADATGYPRPW